ncbi:MAG: hypothetical protein M0R17_10130 [Candidatus Omnitrophica bacterium]|jgi:hypothetical protein|nr:hypothetical protein [Candidatus Omnitrophota bacterium]MDD5253188.1 hypothetical protein [Candidatus Omnitrophota bacterium]
MKKNKIIGKLLLMFAVFTVLGMVLDNDTYWSVYNYATLIFFLSSGIVLLKQK